MKARKRYYNKEKNQQSVSNFPNSNKKRKSKNFKNTKKVTASRKKLRQSIRNSQHTIEFPNEEEPATSNQHNEEMVINQVKKLLGDDSIEEYTGYHEDNNLIQDLNLLMLSSSPDEYEVYCDLIRKEYSYLSDLSYNSMRLKMLNNLTKNEVENTSTTSEESNNISKSLNLSIARRRKKKKSLLLSKNINLKKLSTRKLKQQLRLAASNSFKRRTIDNKSTSISDDCILIEIPREVIVIDDDIETSRDNAKNYPLDDPMTGTEDEKIPIKVCKNQNLIDNCDTNTNNNTTKNVNTMLLSNFITIDCTANTSINPNLETLNDSDLKSLNDSNITNINDSNMKTLSETILHTNISARIPPKFNEIENNNLLKINNNNNLDTDSNISDSIIEISTNSENVTTNSGFGFGDNNYIKPPLYEIPKSNVKVLGSDNFNSFDDVINVYNENLNNIEVVITEEINNGTLKEKSIPSDKSQILSDLLKKNDYKTHQSNQPKNLTNSININRTKPSVPMPIPVTAKSNWDIQKGNSVTKTSKNIDNSIIQIDIDSDDDLSSENDESVVFVSEVASSSKALDFIPLSSDNNNNGTPKKKRKKSVKNSPQLLLNPFKRFKIDLENKQTNKMSTPKNKKPTGEIEFTHSEKKKNEKYNSNTYNPNKDENIINCEKRMIILDGSNIAFGHGNSNYFSSKGLEIAINFFVNKGHEVKAVVPQFRVNYNRSSDGEKLKELYRSGKIVFTPGKNLPDLRTSSYDDRFVLQLALEFDAAIVSNDNYRDLINENPGFKKLIENRVITYTWCNDLFIVAKDPYGKRGPALDFILNRNVEQQNAEKQTVEKQNAAKHQ